MTDGSTVQMTGTILWTRQITSVPPPPPRPPLPRVRLETARGIQTATRGQVPAHIVSSLSNHSNSSRFKVGFQFCVDSFDLYRRAPGHCLRYSLHLEEVSAGSRGPAWRGPGLSRDQLRHVGAGQAARQGRGEHLRGPTTVSQETDRLRHTRHQHRHHHRQHHQHQDAEAVSAPQQKHGRSSSTCIQ